jgi:Domain of unknown function (DUF4279)
VRPLHLAKVCVTLIWKASCWLKLFRLSVSGHFQENEMAKFSAALRVTGDDLDPEVVSRLLNLEPDQYHRKGDPNVGRSGRRYGDFVEGLWLKKSTVEETHSLDEHLNDIASKLQGRETALQELEKRGWQSDIFIGVFGVGDNDVFRIAPQTQKRLAALSLELTFDVYSS